MRPARTIRRLARGSSIGPIGGVAGPLALAVALAGIYAIAQVSEARHNARREPILLRTAQTPQACAIVEASLQRLGDDGELDAALSPASSREAAAQPRVYLDRDSMPCSIDIRDLSYLSVTLQWYQAEERAYFERREDARQRAGDLLLYSGFGSFVGLQHIENTVGRMSEYPLVIDRAGQWAEVHFSLWGGSLGCAFYTVDLENRHGTWEVIGIENVGLIC